MTNVVIVAKLQKLKLINRLYRHGMAIDVKKVDFYSQRILSLYESTKKYNSARYNTFRVMLHYFSNYSRQALPSI